MTTTFRAAGVETLRRAARDSSGALLLAGACLAGGLLIGVSLPRELVDVLSAYGVIVPIAIASAAAANATAVGGGFVFMPLFSLGYGLGGHATLALSLSTQAFGMTSGALGWSLASIDRRALLVACATSGAGMLLGTLVVTPAEETIRTAFAWGSLAVAAAMVAMLWVPTTGAPRPRTRMDDWLFAVACALGGLITAWVAIGIGEVVALWLMFRWRASAGTAIATGVAALAFCSVLGLVCHAALGAVPWIYLAFTAPSVVLGGRLGARLGRRLEAAGRGHWLKALVAVVIALDGAVMFVHA